MDTKIHGIFRKWSKPPPLGSEDATWSQVIASQGYPPTSRLVGGFNQPLWKIMDFDGKDDIPYMNWKIKKMFETTNQIIYYYPI